MIRTWIRLVALVALVLSLALVARPAAASCTATAGTWDDQSPCVVYSGPNWVHLGGQPTSIYYGGTTSYVAAYGNSAAITFQGNSIEYCGHKGPQRGYVSFVLTHPLGAEYLGAVNFYAASFQSNETCVPFAETGGTLNVHNWNTGGQHIDVDYFIVH